MQPFKTVLENDLKALAAGGQEGAAKKVAADMKQDWKKVFSFEK
jgi:hypothetical protein